MSDNNGKKVTGRVDPRSLPDSDHHDEDDARVPGPTTISAAIRRNALANYDYTLNALRRTVDKLAPKHQPAKSDEIRKIQKYLAETSPPPRPENQAGSSRLPQIRPVRGGAQVESRTRHKPTKKRSSSRVRAKPSFQNYIDTPVSSGMRIMNVVNGQPSFPPSNEDNHFRHDFIHVPKPKTELMQLSEEHYAGRRVDDICPRFRSCIPMAGFRNNEITFRTDGLRIVITGHTHFTNQSGTHYRKVIEVVDIPRTLLVKHLRILRTDYGSVIIEEQRGSITDLVLHEAAERNLEQENIVHLWPFQGKLIEMKQTKL